MCLSLHELNSGKQGSFVNRLKFMNWYYNKFFNPTILEAISQGQVLFNIFLCFRVFSQVKFIEYLMIHRIR
jgi:hypothetical protein